MYFQACMAGIVFAKFTKPTTRAETILFSSNALVTLRNGSYYLLCRIGDMRWAKRPVYLLDIFHVLILILFPDQHTCWSPMCRDIFSPKRALRRERSEGENSHNFPRNFPKLKSFISGSSLSSECHGVWCRDGRQSRFLPDVLAGCCLSQDGRQGRHHCWDIASYW